ncbi:MAG TPA: hypothetical protein VM219_01725 [Phycisphaerae bacterium]|nr:hypothetical protein [Phycisphaerae bacterium]HUS44742.1 hypothetical protein [Phycisphaerae bacterium]
MKRFGVAILAAALFWAPAASAGQPEEAAESVFRQWHSLYLDGRKIGYRTVSLHRLPGGGHRIKISLFLKQRIADTKARYVKTIRAEVDAAGRPRALDCQVASGARRWRVKGERLDDSFRLTRTVGEKETKASVPLQADVTFRSWALLATFLGGAGAPAAEPDGPPGRVARWRIIDESLGAVLPDPCLVRIIGPRSIPLGGGKTVSGTAVLEVCGPEVVAHLVDRRGWTLRSVWQSAPLVAEGVTMGEARRMADDGEGPGGVSVPGLEGGRYRNPRMGYQVYVPPYPFVAHVARDADTVRLTDLTDEAWVTVRPAIDPRMATMHAAEQELKRLADLVHQQWAARWDEVEAGEPRDLYLNGREARRVEGTARLGCTTFHFRNVFVVGQGLAYLVTAARADRPVAAVGSLLGSIVASLRLLPPEGRMPIQTSGDRLRIPYYGLEVRRPSERWKAPRHLDGPATVLELAREDQAAVAVLRVLTPRDKESLADFVARRAGLVAEDLGIDAPEAASTTLAGRKGLELAYEGDLLAGEPAQCRAIYTPIAKRIFVLVLVSKTRAEDAREDLERLRESVRFLEAER